MFLTNILEDAFTINWGVVLVGIFIICTLFKIIDGFLQNIKQRFGITFAYEREKQEDHTKISELSKEIKDIQEQIKVTQNTMEEISINLAEMKKSCDQTNAVNKLLNTAVIEIFYDRISQKCKYYINDLSGIPVDEVESFNRMFEIYQTLGGNHGLEKKVDYCNNHLNILPPGVPQDDKE